MRKSKKVWSHKKYKKIKFEGFYEFKKNADRIFVLKAIGSTASKDHVFDSPEAARKQGWV